jgi:hypothetical protein
MNIIIILFIILFYLLTPGILIKIKGNKYVIAIVHALIFSGIIIWLNNLLNIRYEYMTDTSNNDISNNTSNNTNNASNTNNQPVKDNYATLSEEQKRIKRLRLMTCYIY